MTFIKNVQLNVNWLLNQVIGGGKTDLKITAIDDDQLMQFLNFLKDNPFDMPNGESALRWVKNRLSLRYDQSQNQMSQKWEKTRQRYRFILMQIDLILSVMPPPETQVEAGPTLSVSFEEPAG